MTPWYGLILYFVVFLTIKMLYRFNDVCVKSHCPKHGVVTSFQSYPTIFFCEITVRGSKYCLQKYKARERLQFCFRSFVRTFACLSVRSFIWPFTWGKSHRRFQVWYNKKEILVLWLFSCFITSEFCHNNNKFVNSNLFNKLHSAFMKLCN